MDCYKQQIWDEIEIWRRNQFCVFKAAHTIYQGHNQKQIFFYRIMAGNGYLIFDFMQEIIYFVFYFVCFFQKMQRSLNLKVSEIMSSILET